MATPSSSATSPSPPMTYLQHNSVPPHSTASTSTDPLERDQRQKAVKKFLARAEISMVTRALRTRLSYASYKATHNIHHVPLRDLEAQTQTQSQTASFSRTIAAKRKAAGSNNYYNNPATQGPNGLSAGTGALRRGGSGHMPPPLTTSSPRAYYPAVNGNPHATTSNSEPGSSSRTVHPSPSLYTSILAPPPTKQARTIHNAGDPPVPASSRPVASPRARTQKPASRNTAEAPRSHGKNRKPDVPHGPTSPNRRKVKHGSTDKGKRKQQSSAEMDVDVDGDVDMKAAATLTSLLLHHRPSITGSASSPRSSIDDSEAGSAYSHSHFAQSSARTIAPTSPPMAVSTVVAASTATEPSFRVQTPPPGLATTNATTPRPAPTDNEAASLMLFLATSPSPARPTNKDSRDLAAYRVLGGGPGVLRDKGRVLFASGAGAESPGPGGSAKIQPLARGGDTSFTSSISSIGTEMGIGNSADAFSKPIPSQLLPPPSLPPQTLPRSPSGHRDMRESPRPAFTQGPVEFNFSDFIHASPSPSRGTAVQGPKGNLGLRADVGRKLFEEEQMRHLSGSQSPGKRREERGLGAGIDLVPS